MTATTDVDRLAEAPRSPVLMLNDLSDLISQTQGFMDLVYMAAESLPRDVANPLLLGAGAAQDKLIEAQRIYERLRTVLLQTEPAEA